MKNNLNDERLDLQKLKNYKLLFFIQTFLILMLLGVNLIKTHFDIFKSKELFIIFFATLIIHSILEMSITKEISEDLRKNIKSVLWGLLIFTLSVIIVVFFFSKETIFIALGITLIADLLIFIVSYFILFKK